MSRYEVGWSVRLSFRYPIDVAGPEALVDSAQRVAVACARTPRDATVQFESVLREAAPSVAYALFAFGGQENIVTDIPQRYKSSCILLIQLAGCHDAKYHGGIRHPPCLQTCYLSPTLQSGTAIITTMTTIFLGCSSICESLRIHHSKVARADSPAVATSCAMPP